MTTSFFLVLYLAIFLLLHATVWQWLPFISPNMPPDPPSNLTASTSVLTNFDSTGMLFFYTANGKYLFAYLNLTSLSVVQNTLKNILKIQNENTFQSYFENTKYKQFSIILKSIQKIVFLKHFFGGRWWGQSTGLDPTISPQPPPTCGGW